MYIDYRIRADHRDQSNKIPASRFKILSSRVLSGATVSAVAVMALTLFSLLALAATPYGSVSFWMEIGLAAIGVACTMLCIRQMISEVNKQRSRELHTATTSEEYYERLAKDEGVSYAFDLQQYLKNREKNDEDFHLDITAADNQRSIYMINGQQVDAGGIQENDVKAYQYANQGSVYDMYCLLMSRYQNDTLGIRVSQRGRNNPEGKNTKYHLLGEKKHRYLEVSQLFQISDESNIDEVADIKYLKATMSIDLQSGNATVKWDSPQDDLPKL